jgi:xanthine dehydrogenase accessory factor
MKVWAHIASCLENGDACTLVTVTSVDGSAPREAGARLVVLHDLSFSGTIGGGTLEFEAIRKAADAAKTGRAAFFEQSVSLGPDLGQCCGGRAKLAFEVFTPNELETVRLLCQHEQVGKPFGTLAVLEEGRIAKRQILPELPKEVFAIALDPGTGNQVLTERFGAAHRSLYLFGAGHVGRALVLALAPLPFDVTWIDSRADQFPGPVPANVTKICVANPAEVLVTAPEDAFVLAVTHSHGFDEEIMARALLEQRFEYCGVIGSKTKRARFRKRLKARGLTEALLSKMVCPVGNTAIKSKHPAVIAAGVVVDLLERDEAGHQQDIASGGLAQIIPHGQ